MTPDVLTIKFDPDGKVRGASIRTTDQQLHPIGPRGVLLADVMAMLSRDHLAQLAAAAQAQIAVIDAGAPPKKPWYRLFGS